MSIVEKNMTIEGARALLTNYILDSTQRSAKSVEMKIAMDALDFLVSTCKEHEAEQLRLKQETQ